MLSKNKYIIAIDQGTTSTRSIIYNEKLIPLTSFQKEIKQYYPQEGWVEHNPNEIWNSVKYTLKKVIKNGKVNPSNVISIAIANQRETTVLWDRNTGKPIYNAIVWQDRRTSNYCNKIGKKKFSKAIKKITGLKIDPYFSATKIKWILDNIKISKKLIRQNRLLFGTIDTWLCWKLTKGKVHLTDITNASRTMLFDIQKHKWSYEMLNFFNIPKSILPKVVENDYNFGDVNIFGKKISIKSIIGDQQSALIGNACFEKGMTKITYGTGSFMIMNIGNKIKYSKNNLLTSIAYKINGKTTYCLEGSMFTAGSAIQWLRDNLKLIKNSKETEKLYYKAKKDQNIVMIPAFTGLGAPYWKPNTRAAILGINRNTGIPEIVKATIQSICFQTKDLIKNFEQDSNHKISVIKIDGGMIQNNAFTKFLSDILNLKVLIPLYSETTALGTAYMAAVNSNLIKDIKEIRKKVKIKKIEKPSMSLNNRKKIYKIWEQSVKNFILTS